MKGHQRDDFEKIGFRGGLGVGELWGKLVYTHTCKLVNLHCSPFLLKDVKWPVSMAVMGFEQKLKVFLALAAPPLVGH